MGYGKTSLSGEGIHLRLYSRAFIIEQNGDRIVFVSADGGMISHPIKRDVSAFRGQYQRPPYFIISLYFRNQVLRRLHKRYGSMYRFENVLISGTHTHGAPGGTQMFVLYDISTLGFNRQSFNAFVTGIFNVTIIFKLTYDQ